MTFQTYWLCDGVRVENFKTVEKFVLRGAIAIEVSAEQQQQAHEERKQRAKENAALDELIRQKATERAHEQSPEGKQEQARRVAAENPGGIVSGGKSVFAELDAFGPERTSLLNRWRR